VHGIGQEFALYYEAYALCLEKRGSHKDAMAVYDLGVSNFAMPIDRLRKKLTAFHKRMAKRVERDARRSLQATPMNSHQQENSTRQRQALSSIQRPGTLFTHAQQQQQAGAQSQSVFQTPVNTSSSGAHAGRINNNDSEFRIYTETPSDLNNAASSIGRNALSTIAQGGGEEKGPSESQLDWARLQRQEDLSKENEQKPTKWNQYSITQPNSAGGAAMQHQLSTPNVNALEVLVDEEFEEQTPFALEQRPGNVRQAAEGRPRSSTRKPKVKPSQTVMVYDEGGVKDQGTGEDVSFEERRAAIAFSRRSLANDKEVPSSSNDNAMLAGAVVDQLSNLEIAAGGASQVEVEVEESAVPEEDSSHLGIASPKAAAEDVTLYTKEAFEAIDAMFTSQYTNTQARKTKPAHLLDLGESDIKATPSHRVSQKLDFGGHPVATEAGASDLEIYEDTTILPSTSINECDLDPQQNNFPTEAAAGILSEHNGDKENLEGEGQQPSPSCGGVRESEGGMLQEMGQEELFARGIEIGNGLPSDDDDDDIFERDENLLELPPAERLGSFIPGDETDDFQVFCDE
jgi:hypothetical protein